MAGTHKGLKEENEGKRGRFYEAEILKAIRHKSVSGDDNNQHS